MSAVILDTNVASLSFKGRLPAAIKDRLADAEVVLSFVTFAEMVEWSITVDWGERLVGKLEHWLDRRAVIATDDELCRIWGKISAAAENRGRPRPDNDTWIAACCISHGIPLVTHNVKDFADFAMHHGLVLIEA
jgi:predicted nucleic acid-binding protein